MVDADELRRAVLDAIDEPVTELPRDTRPSLGRTVRRATWRVRTRIADLVHDRGIDTAKAEYDPAHAHPDRVRYEPSAWSYLGRVLSADDVKPTDVFIDFGSGKGRVVLQAAAYPFGRVVGVEISEELTRVAEANVERRRRRLRCENVELVTCDAAEYRIPDDMTYAYFYFPFVGETFRRVLRNIVASIDRAPREVRLIYACPEKDQYIAETGRFRLERRSAGGKRDYVGQRIEVFVSEPAA